MNKKNQLLKKIYRGATIYCLDSSAETISVASALVYIQKKLGLTGSVISLPIKNFQNFSFLPEIKNLKIKKTIVKKTTKNLILISQNQKGSDVSGDERRLLSEKIDDLIRKDFKNLIDEKLSTAVLAGIVSGTRGMKRTHLRPETLKRAAELMELGADRRLSTESLFHSRKEAEIRLWGKILKSLRETNNSIIGQVTDQDFKKTGTNFEDIPDIVHEIIAESTKSEAIIIIFKHKKSSGAWLYFTDRKTEKKWLKKLSLLEIEVEKIGDFFLISNTKVPLTKLEKKIFQD